MAPHQPQNEPVLRTIALLGVIPGVLLLLLGAIGLHSFRPALSIAPLVLSAATSTVYLFVHTNRNEDRATVGSNQENDGAARGIRNPGLWAAVDGILALLYLALLLVIWIKNGSMWYARLPMVYMVTYGTVPPVANMLIHFYLFVYRCWSARRRSSCPRCGYGMLGRSGFSAACQQRSDHGALYSLLGDAGADEDAESARGPSEEIRRSEETVTAKK